MTSFSRKLKSILTKANKLKAEDCDLLIVQATKEGKALSELLLHKKVVTETELLSLIARDANMPPVDLDKIKVNKDVLASVPIEAARDYGVLPLEKIGDFLTLAVSNPFDVLKLDDIKIITGCHLRPVVALETSIAATIKKVYRSVEEEMDEILSGFKGDDMEFKEAGDEEDAVDLNALSDEGAPVVKMVNKIIGDAVGSGVSDIHIEPFEKKLIVRYRKDGDLTEAIVPPKKMQNGIASRIKIMAKLDIAEKHKPQDGKFQMKFGNKGIDFRVSILPVVWGEKVVMRILDSTNLALDIKGMGFEERAITDFLWACDRPHGMILVTGPTGSGKSTTLYSAVKHIASPDINLVTVEDPVEYSMEGINQVPVNPKRGTTFAGALRSILRQDPDVILVGEIRDAETLEIGVKAALTGHLVLSTLHTNDAPATITRMVDMGLDPFMVASSTLLICAQRLARKLCEHCKAPTEVPKPELLNMGFTEAELKRPDFKLYKPVGCAKCTNGYKGRFAILETLRMTESIQRMVVERRNVIDIKKKAIEEGMLTLRRVGLFNAGRGKTALEEVLRATMAD
jgi:type IV pilus assembly protein PilB